MGQAIKGMTGIYECSHTHLHLVWFLLGKMSESVKQINMNRRGLFVQLVVLVSATLSSCRRIRTKSLPPHVHISFNDGYSEKHFWSYLPVCSGVTWGPGAAQFGKMRLLPPFSVVFEGGKILEVSPLKMIYDGVEIAPGHTNYLVDASGVSVDSYIRTFE